MDRRPLSSEIRHAHLPAVSVGCTSGKTDGLPKDTSLASFGDATTVMGKQRRGRFDDVGVLDSYGLLLLLVSRSESNERFNAMHEAIAGERASKSRLPVRQWLDKCAKEEKHDATKTNTRSRSIERTTCERERRYWLDLISNEREID